MEITMRQAALFLLLILAAALAQAQAPAAAPAPKAAPAAKSAPAPAPASASTAESPKRKSGLWEIKASDIRSEHKTRDFQMCIDQAKDEPLQHLNGITRKEACKPDKVQRSGDTTTVDAVCSLNKTTAKTHAVITGKFDSAYKIESKSTFDPPLRGKTEGTATMEARWLGPCAADQKPGDVILASGKKVNVNDRAGAAAIEASPSSTTPGGESGISSKQFSSPGRKPGTPPSPTPSQPPSQ
jgi:hypothetical protein